MRGGKSLRREEGNGKTFDWRMGDGGGRWRGGREGNNEEKLEEERNGVFIPLPPLS